MKTILNVTFISFLLTVFSCNTTEPPEDNIPSGRRDYVWTAETLLTTKWKNEWFGITDVWGISSNSIWVTAAGVIPNDCLWHYNGTKWENYWEKYNQYLNPNLSTVFGLTPDEVWIGDGYGSIWKYDGNSWKKFQTFSLSGYDFISIGSIYGPSQNNLYAVGVADNNDGSGYKGVILKYDGTKWLFLNIPDIRASFNQIKRMSNEKYLIRALNFDNGVFTEKLFVFDGNNDLKEIYSDYHYPGLYEMNGDVYITINRKIYKCLNDELVFWKEFPGSSYYGVFLGRSEKDFFGAGYDGILHYNGTDLVNLYQTQELDISGHLIFEKDVFFEGYTSGKRYVMIRGTLKEE